MAPLRTMTLAALAAFLASAGAPGAGAADYEVYTQRDPLRWQKPLRYPNEAQARSAAERQCFDRKIIGVAPARKVKYVNKDTGEETVYRCIDGIARRVYGRDYD